MEQRPNFQLDTSQPVMITPLQEQNICTGQLVASSDDEVKVKVNENLEVGSILKLETDDIWMLAEVVRCQSGKDGYSAQLTVLNWINKAELKNLFWEGEEPALAA